MAVFLGSELSCAFEEIAQTLKNDLLLEFPWEVLKSILSRLEEKNVVKLTDGRYQLSSDRRKEIHNEGELRARIWQDLANQLISKAEESLGRTVTTEEKALIADTWLRFLSSFFLDHAHVSAALIAGVGPNTPQQPRVCLDRALEHVGDASLRDSTRIAILDVVGNPTEATAGFLFHLNQNLVCIEVLNLDPECQALEKAAFSRITLLLDTNVIIALLCPTSRQHVLTRELVDLTGRVGAILRFTKKTMKEFLDVLDDSNRDFQRLGKVPLRFLAAVDDDFITSYAGEKHWNPHLSWEGYHLTMKQAESVLRTKYGISLLDEEHEEILKFPVFNEISREVSDCFEKFRLKIKKPEVAAHDAYHLILVRELRKGKDLTLVGPSLWFLSYDQTLPYVDPFVTERLQYTDQTASTMLVDIWLQMIEPLLVGRVESKEIIDVFSEYLRSQFSEIPFRIDKSTIAELQGDWLNYSWLGTEDIEIILGEKFVEDYVSLLRKETALSEEERRKVEEYKRKLEIKVDSIADEKITSLTVSVKELKAKLDGESTKREGLEREREEFRKKWMTVSGILGAVFLAVGLSIGIGIIMRAFEQSALNLAVELVLIVGGAVLLYFAIYPEKAKVGVNLGVSASTTEK